MVSYAELKRSEKRSIETALDMKGGYLLDFSNRTIEEHFEDEFGIEFYSTAYARNGNSKAIRLRSILEGFTGAKAAVILKNLWEVRQTLPNYGEPKDPETETIVSQTYFKVVSRLEGDQPEIDHEIFSSFDESKSLHSLIQSIERDIRADKPDAAVDRLHLFCIKKFRHLLDIRQIENAKSEPLNSLVGKYKKALEAEAELTEMSLLFIRYSISVFEKFNEVRNNHSLAHDNILLPPQEARFIFDAVSAVLRFIKSIDKDFDAKLVSEQN
ncbi:MAG: hypothetical protein ACJAXK_001191 [Yoonia sp.]|jgi:hypothetical protein